MAGEATFRLWRCFYFSPGLCLKITTIAIKSSTLMLHLFVKYKERFLYSFEIANVANISYAFMLAFLMQYQKRNSCCLISTDVTIKCTFCLDFFRINPRDMKIPLFLKAKLRTFFYISKLFLAPGVCV